ncbi:hypothetical protein G4H71_06635 [Rhodococcus triatomae]|uniref:Uncharacterized protein n=1 Tax=Rhodococcus triatomae TaxID=300028 RepID=A0A1G8B5M9_9NOCA|nr:hypothetical protein [Rhodococcus triatomae]QNG17579.1 hypothetical protein G4H72_01410 [Rhodococcus triatomae]QNG22753.1 hypothetical protein G4H71_06635 [Rhodococcus triatomae]SDH28303.1 hypothetical protein SAMN05444695_101655 [Rhodococcus triatomae]
MNSASQSNPDAAAARGLVSDIEKWSSQGRRLAAPVWFPLLCVATAVFAWVPAALLLGESSYLYWVVVAPLTAIASGWYFATRRVQPAEAPGLLALATGAVMLLGVLALVLFYRGSWANVAAWLVVGVGLGILALTWRSVTTGAVAAVALVTAAVVTITEPAQSEVVLVLVVGTAAALGVFVEVLRTESDSRS